MNNYILKKLSVIKFIIFNLKKNFFLKKNQHRDSIILIEFNAFHIIHVVYSVICNFFYKSDKKYKIIAYYNYDVLITNLKKSLYNKFSWWLGKLFWINNFGIYKSFGVSEFIRPKLNIDHKSKVEKTILKIKKLSKNEILILKLNGIKIGDLLYDTYIKKYELVTIDLEDKKFYELCSDFFYMFYFWYDYLKNKNIKKIIGVHTVYSYALILRIALSYKKECLIVNDECISRLSKKNYFANSNFKSYSKKFLKLTSKLKKEGIKFSNEILKKRLKGYAGVKYDLISKKSSFHNKKNKRQIFKSSKLKVLVCTRNLFDAVHVFGEQLFVDNLEWLECLGSISNNTDYDWYIKTHRLYEGKFKKYQPKSNSTINEIIKKYPKLKILNPNYSHRQIISEGINFVITQHGSVGYEYAYLGIPVINSSINNPQISYKFNINPKSKLEFIKKIKTLKNIKLSINKRDVIKFYFMRNIYQDKKWFFKDQTKLMKYIGGWDGKYSTRIYEYAVKYLNKKENIKRIENNLKNFLKTNDHTISIKHTLNEF